jgi:ribosomal protein L24
MAAKLKKGDKVVVLTGKDKGKKGEVVGQSRGEQGRRRWA